MIRGGASPSQAFQAAFNEGEITSTTCAIRVKGYINSLSIWSDVAKKISGSEANFSASNIKSSTATSSIGSYKETSIPRLRDWLTKYDSNLFFRLQYIFKEVMLPAASTTKKYIDDYPSITKEEAKSYCSALLSLTENARLFKDQFKNIALLDLTNEHRLFYEKMKRLTDEGVSKIVTGSEGLYVSDCTTATTSESEKKRNGITLKDVFGAILQGLAIYGSSIAQDTGGGYMPRLRCSEISSWNIAQTLLQEGYEYLDRDNDGEACEELR
ncbi:excalibur calcium-binding domain protein [Synechococcus sp. A15-127]|nr:excalibur calcium-binding domain protein [Synechococcus sp. A15-127]